MTQYKKLILSLAVFVISVGSTLSGVAFAEDKDNSYSHQPNTATWEKGLVCGDHKCASGELPQNPPHVQPMRGL